MYDGQPFKPRQQCARAKQYLRILWEVGNDRSGRRSRGGIGRAWIAVAMSLLFCILREFFLASPGLEHGVT